MEARLVEDQIPFVAALEMSDENRPIHLNLNRVSGFTSNAIEAWSVDSLAPGSLVFSDGLACFRAVAAAGLADRHNPEKHCYRMSLR